LTPEELLAAFPSSELSRVVSRTGIGAGGSKLQRVYRLLDAADLARAYMPGVLVYFRTESIRRVCSRFGIRAPSKHEMILALTALLGPEGANLSSAARSPVKPKLPAVVQALSQLVLPVSLSRDEAEAVAGIARALRRLFVGVSTQVNVGGHLGYRVDIAVGNGGVGVEVKLAHALLESSGELYRAVGQAMVYKHLRFADSLAVAVVGPTALLGRPALIEIMSFLDSVGASVAYVRME
jgi:hypothetical protein